MHHHPKPFDAKFLCVAVLSVLIAAFLADVLLNGPLYDVPGRVRQFKQSFAKSELRKALKEADDILRHDAANGDMYAMRGAVYNALGQNDRAIDDAKKAIDLKSGARGYLTLGQAYAALKDAKKSVEALDLGIQSLKPLSGPEDKTVASMLYSSRGLARAMLRQYDAALADYDKALEIHDYPLFRYNRGYLYYSLGKMDEAISDLTACIRDSQMQMRDAYLFRALAYMRSGRSGEALADLDFLIKISDDHIPRCVRALIRNAQGRHDEAIADMERAIALKKQDPNADARIAFVLKGPSYEERLSKMYSERADQAINGNRAQDALVDMDKAIQLNVGNALFYWQRGDVKRRLNRSKEAVADFEQAVELNPEFAPRLNPMIEHLRNEAAKDGMASRI
jgi:tetratricopeptide (TPR) repeat protein